MDRTEWEFGLFNINLLVIGVQYKGVVVPLYFKSLAKKGCSFTHQRISVIKSLLQVIPVKKISSFSADREFVGGKWFKFLIDKGIPFVMRIKKDTQVRRHASDASVPVEEIAKRIKKIKKRYLKTPI